MTSATKTVTVKVERTILAPAGEVFDAWLDPKIPGTPWHDHEKLIVNPDIDGLWYWLSLSGTPHYGRFIALDRPGRIQHSWMSPNTSGLESMVTITFEEKSGATLLTLVHSGLPNEDMAKAHEKGWNSIADRFSTIFAA
jgi:uncharacterized protein YndB with AHSA1/START domain